jgi:predicted acylesterase/phospholipase RssA
MYGKTALVLSAGGYFGAYQAGVWKALERQVKIDLVVGASVGALNGWSIAAGCGGQELIDRWMQPATAGFLTFTKRPNFRNGYFEQGPLLKNAEMLIQEFQPQIPFGMVTVELPWLRPRLIQTEQVTPQHLLASCSIPLVMPSVMIGGRRFTDGGLIDKLPIWAAVEMGATEIIAIDSLPNVNPWWARAASGVLTRIRPAPLTPQGIKVTVISPSEALGTSYDAVIWKRENIDRWVALGARDAEQVFAL